MDQNNQPPLNPPQENTDLNKQYQDILDRYSKELSPAEPTSPPIAPTETPPPLPTPTPEPSEPLSPQPNNPVESFTPPTPPVEAQIQEVPPSGGGFFKFLFFFSLLVFLGVFGTIAYTVFYKGQLPEFISGPAPTVTETQPSPTITSDFCDVNDKIVKKGDTFPAADGCNTCTCGADLTISCTDKACDATKSSSLTPTKSASSSSTKVSPTIKPSNAPSPTKSSASSSAQTNN